MQGFIIAVVLVCAVSYASYRIWLALKTTNDPCAGCAGCPMREIKRQQKQPGFHRKFDCHHKK
ncbi:MAG: FeoB-associated Cys-rich membrane protein [Prevotella sp.]|nr:FeoB-associated Cys-rich membrane protein [Prevotella sp.]